MSFPMGINIPDAPHSLREWWMAVMEEVGGAMFYVLAPFILLALFAVAVWNSIFKPGRWTHWGTITISVVLTGVLLWCDLQFFYIIVGTRHIFSLPLIVGAYTASIFLLLLLGSDEKKKKDD